MKAFKNRRNPWRALLVVLLTSLASAATGMAVDIRISDLRDIDFGSVSPTVGDLAASISICVALSEPARYSVIARGTGPGDAFTLSSGIADIPISVFFSDRPNRRRGVALAPGVPEGGLRGRQRRRRRDCNRPTARIEMRVDSADLVAAPAGRYRGALTITVAPE